jgi:hypothetical protein
VRWKLAASSIGSCHDALAHGEIARLFGDGLVADTDWLRRRLLAGWPRRPYRPIDLVLGATMLGERHRTELFDLDVKGACEVALRRRHAPFCASPDNHVVDRR